MRDYLPDLSTSFGRERAAANHDDWLTQDDPFQPLPVLDHRGIQLPDQPHPSEDIILNDDELKLMLPMLLHDQDHPSSSLQSNAHAVAPKNTRKERPAKRPLGELSACVRNERSLDISTLNTSEELHQADADRKGMKKRIQHHDSSSSGTPYHIARVREARGEPAWLLGDFLARQDGSLVKTAPIPDPLMYDILQSYKTLNDHQTTPAEKKRHRSNLNIPHPQWHWHDSSVSMDVPSPHVVTRNDSNGTPQTYKIVYAAITMPYAVANKFDPAVLYISAKGAIESLVNHNNNVVNMNH